MPDEWLCGYGKTTSRDGYAVTRSLVPGDTPAAIDPHVDFLALQEGQDLDSILRGQLMRGLGETDFFARARLGFICVAEGASEDGQTRCEDGQGQIDGTVDLLPNGTSMKAARAAGSGSALASSRN